MAQSGILVAGQEREGTTCFRCGGCGAVTRFAHFGQQYGRLVHSFLEQHGRCGNAVEITAERTDPGPQ